MDSGRGGGANAIDDGSARGANPMSIYFGTSRVVFTAVRRKPPGQNRTFYSPQTQHGLAVFRQRRDGGSGRPRRLNEFLLAFELAAVHILDHLNKLLFRLARNLGQAVSQIDH
ncbi:hypothetical protein Rcae01_02625 [Novipirellula caenicola]|uniref:Uncharacterized protein n=1 Tax=Novipirellula caenicola TaxID=1536901 RepID=A0ABP9VSC7_9BACT